MIPQLTDLTHLPFSSENGYMCRRKIMFEAPAFSRGRRKGKETPTFLEWYRDWNLHLAVKSNGVAGTGLSGIIIPPPIRFWFFFFLSDHKYFKKISHIHLNLAETSQRQNRVQNSLTYALNEDVRTHGENGGSGVHPLACFQTRFLKLAGCVIYSKLLNLSELLLRICKRRTKTCAVSMKQRKLTTQNLTLH